MLFSRGKCLYNWGSRLTLFSFPLTIYTSFMAILCRFLLGATNFIWKISFLFFVLLCNEYGDNLASMFFIRSTVWISSILKFISIPDHKAPYKNTSNLKSFHPHWSYEAIKNHSFHNVFEWYWWPTKQPKTVNSYKRLSNKYRHKKYEKLPRLVVIKLNYKQKYGKLHSWDESLGNKIGTGIAYKEQNT